MELYLLGTGTCAPNPRRAPSGYFLAIGPTRFLIDPGPGALSRAAAAGIDPFDIEAIVLTHHHLDHSADLMPYLFSYKNCVANRPRRDTRIIAPEGFTDVFGKLLDVYRQWVLSDEYSVSVEEMTEASVEFPGVVISSAPMLHGANAIGYKFEKKGGPALAYSGDTGYCEEIVKLAEGADLLLLECSYPDGAGVEGHLTPSEAAQVALRSGAKKLALTHFYPETDTDAAKKVISDAGYGGEIIIGEDGMKITV